MGTVRTRGNIPNYSKPSPRALLLAAKPNSTQYEGEVPQARRAMVKESLACQPASQRHELHHADAACMVRGEHLGPPPPSGPANRGRSARRIVCKAWQAYPLGLQLSHVRSSSHIGITINPNSPFLLSCRLAPLRNPKPTEE